MCLNVLLNRGYAIHCHVSRFVSAIQKVMLSDLVGVHTYMHTYISAKAALHMCSLVMFMERHCTVGANSYLHPCEWYASHMQHTKLNQMYKRNAGCSMVVEHSMSTHEPVLFKLIISTPNIGTSIHAVKINRAKTNFMLCSSNMAYVSLCTAWTPNMQKSV
jgi:hypothetical protein